MADFVSKNKKDNEDVVQQSKSPNKVKAMLKEKESPVNQFKIDDYDDSDDSGSDNDAKPQGVSNTSVDVGEMMSSSSDDENEE